MSFFITPMLPIEIITDKYYSAMQASAEIIVADRIAPKVMRLKNGNMIKFFRRKRLLSSAIFAPYGVRFVNNAIRLHQLGVPTVTPLRLMHCPARKMHVVEYTPLEGELLRGILQRQNNEALMQKTACFISSLHDKGIYFRSLHFENIIYRADEFGLIDVADMKIYRCPLNKKLRARNFQHFLRYPADKAIIDAYGQKRFEADYSDCRA